MDRVHIRRVRPGDESGLVDFYAGLSAESRHSRFLGCTAGIGSSRSRMLCSADHVHEEGLVAVAHTGTGDAIVGHLCVVDVGAGTVEVAIAVADAYQHAGIGQRLFDAGLAWAAQHNVRLVTASAFADNAPILRLLSSAEYPVRIAPADAGTVTVLIDLARHEPRALKASA